MEKQDRIIGYIENGIVIDHIPLGKVWEIARLLSIDKKREGRVSLGEGYGSKKMDGKGVIKVEGLKLSDYQLNLIALVAKDATVSIVVDGKIDKKVKAEIPTILKAVIVCMNPNCISNDAHEKILPLIKYQDNDFVCHYCSKEFKRDELKFFNSQEIF